MSYPKGQDITDPKTHQPRWVTATVAARFVEMHRNVFALYVAEGRIEGKLRGKRLKYHVDDLVVFKAWLEDQGQQRSA